MGAFAPGGPDQANQVLSGNFAATGVSGSIALYGSFNVSLYGSSGPNGAWTGSVQLERSFDGGATWLVCSTSAAGAQAVYSAGSKDVSVVVSEPERGVLYRLDCTAFTSGPINYRISASGGAAQTWTPNP